MKSATMAGEGANVVVTSPSNMLATEVDTHVDMSSSGLIVRMERHNDSTFVVAEELGGARLPEAEISKKEAQVEGFFSTLGESIVFCLLSTDRPWG